VLHTFKQRLSMQHKRERRAISSSAALSDVPPEYNNLFSTSTQEKQRTSYSVLRKKLPCFIVLVAFMLLISLKISQQPTAVFFAEAQCNGNFNNLHGYYPFDGSLLDRSQYARHLTANNIYYMPGALNSGIYVNSTDSCPKLVTDILKDSVEFVRTYIYVF